MPLITHFTATVIWNWYLIDEFTAYCQLHSSYGQCTHQNFPWSWRLRGFPSLSIECYNLFSKWHVFSPHFAWFCFAALAMITYNEAPASLYTPQAARLSRIFCSQNLSAASASASIQVPLAWWRWIYWRFFDFHLYSISGVRSPPPPPVPLKRIQRCKSDAFMMPRLT